VSVVEELPQEVPHVCGKVSAVFEDGLPYVVIHGPGSSLGQTLDIYGQVASVLMYSAPDVAVSGVTMHCPGLGDKFKV